jgi:hypothetical protein
MGSTSPDQPVPDGQGGGALARLLDCSTWSLADWYATPLTTAEAGAWLSATQQAIQLRLRGGASCFTLQVLLQICHFWLDELHGTACRTMPQPAASARHAALPDLVYGQLLASRKLRPAGVYLSRGFRQAAHFLEPADYFRVLGEHELLAGLPLSDRPAAPLDLPALLNEAAVIRRLQGTDRRLTTWPRHMDTLG